MIYEKRFLFCHPIWTFKSKPLKKTILTLITGSLVFVSCTKDSFERVPRPELQKIPLPCVEQNENTAGRSYITDSVLEFDCKEKHCGMMPLSAKSYWVYLDSIFEDGIFVRSKYDTLRFSSLKSVSDGLVWWESNLDVGIPRKLYTNDSSLYGIHQRLYDPAHVDAKKEYSLFPGDSLRYLAGFDDIAAFGRSLKVYEPYATQAGTFLGCIYFEKHARNYRKDQVIFKPGLGVLKYIREKAPMGTPFLKMEQILTLISFHIE